MEVVSHDRCGQPDLRSTHTTTQFREFLLIGSRPEADHIKPWLSTSLQRLVVKTLTTQHPVDVVLIYVTGRHRDSLLG
jgi:hypothetical protein